MSFLFGPSQLIFFYKISTKIKEIIITFCPKNSRMPYIWLTFQDGGSKILLLSSLPFFFIVEQFSNKLIDLVNIDSNGKLLD